MMNNKCAAVRRSVPLTWRSSRGTVSALYPSLAATNDSVQVATHKFAKSKKTSREKVEKSNTLYSKHGDQKIIASY